MSLSWVDYLEGRVKIVKVGCPRCRELLLTEVRPGLHLVRCSCGGYLLVLADENGDMRSVRPIEVERPLSAGRLRLARPELWPKTLEHLKADVLKALHGVNPEAGLTPAAQRALKLLLELGVLEVEGGREGGG